MARALIITLPLQGHMTPLLPLVAELVARGDEAVAYSTDAFGSRIQRTGAQLRRYAPGRVHDLARLPERLETISLVLMRIVEEVLDADLPAMRQHRPDYLVTDSVAPWGQWIGALLNVPVITSISTFAVNRHVLAQARSYGMRPKRLATTLSKLEHVSKALWLRRALMRRYGVRGPGIFGSMFGTSAVNLVHTSHSFQPRADTFDGSFHFVGPPTSVGIGSEHDLGFVDASTGAAPLIYASLGTVFNAHPGFFRDCFEAFRGEPVRVILSVGSQRMIDALGPPPANVKVAAFVPQLEVLARTSVFVTHGGMNSVGEALRLNVPMVTVPQMGEQELVSRRVEEVEAGLYLAPTDVTADTLRRCVRHVLSDARFRRAATRIGETLRTAGGTTRAADVIRDALRDAAGAQGADRRKRAIQ